MEKALEMSLVFIGAAVIFVPLFKHFGFGSVLGYLLAGILVGPHGFEFIVDAESVLHFAEIGVVLLLFIIGLEMQPLKLWSMKKQLVGMGGLQIFATTIILTLLGWGFGMRFETSLVIAFSLSLSSTAFAVQSLTERNQLNTQFGHASFSILLMQDIVAIPALAAIPILIGSETSGSGTWIKLAQFFIVLVILILVSRYVVRPFFRLIVATRTREIFTAATLFIVLGVAMLMLKIDLSAALGTFIAGVLLAESEYRHELEANIDPFKSLFLGLFFMSVGMTVDLTLLIRQPLFLISAAIGYLFLKSSVIYAVARLFKFNHENAKMVGLQIAQGGEFAFVILAMAEQFQMVDSDMAGFFVAMITLSMAITPILMMINEFFFQPTEKLSTPTYDRFDNETPQVIIAGFGRFGQIFGRIMRAQNIPFVAIDHDSAQIDLLRKFGSKVYFGDAARPDLLEAAGALRAKFLVIAVDNVEVSLEIARTAKKYFPNLQIFARARNRGHVFDLLDTGVQQIKRETIDSSLHFVRDLLIEMGYPLDRAKRIVKRFKEHDEAMMLEQYKVRHDDDRFVSVAKQGTDQLAQVLQQESAQFFIDPNSAKNNE